MTTIYPKPFKLGNYWYFRYTDHDGKRKKMSTRTGNKTKAQKYIHDFIDHLQRGGYTEFTLRNIITLYTDPETNPRRRDALTTDKSYGDKYASHIAFEATELLEALETIPGFLDKPLYIYSRRDIKDAAQHIVRTFGQTEKARKVYKLLKVAFSQAADDGLIQINTAQGLADIKPKSHKQIYAIPPHDIRIVLKHREIFPCQLAYDIFTVLASCGLRRSEMLALIPNQVNLTERILTINRAFKDDRCTVIGLPKWGKARIIAMPQIAQDPLRRIFQSNMSIPISSRKLYTWVKIIGQHASLLTDVTKPEAWRAITPHMLRHSLNTMLRMTDVPEVATREFMSWTHQDPSIQDAYTHIYAENLRPVADKIDELLGHTKPSSLKLHKA